MKFWLYESKRITVGRVKVKTQRTGMPLRCLLLNPRRRLAVRYRDRINVEIRDMRYVTGTGGLTDCIVKNTLKRKGARFVWFS